MMRFTGFRPSTAFAAAAMAFVAGCASDSALAPEMAPQVSALVVSNANVIIPGASAGSFANAINPTNLGRATGAFWDNKSADEINGLTKCNAGYYALATIQAGCDNEAAGSYANRGGGYTTYFGDAAGNRDATAFSFASGYEYSVTLKGSYAGGTSEVGYYTVSGGVNTYVPVAAWGLKTVGASVVINTGGKPWGFYIKNAFLSPTGGCAGTSYYCSQAEGGFTAPAFNQFALFGNAAGNAWMVGIEDNWLQLLPNGLFRDSDYNDYMFSVVARELAGGQGCSPGYWKNHSDWSSTAYTQGQSFNTIFGRMIFSPDRTLQVALSTGGGGLDALGRIATSALLNASSTGVNYELSPAQVIKIVQDAYDAGTPGAITAAKDRLEALQDVDGRICPLN